MRNYNRKEREILNKLKEQMRISTNVEPEKSVEAEEPVNQIKKDRRIKEGIIEKAIIYIIEHNTNPQLKYVGQTRDTLSKRWNGHLATSKLYNKMFYRLGFFVNYYGVENFSIREYKIYKNITQDFLDDEEKKYVFELGTLNTQYCNEDITIKITK
jgi:hypothetical protein